LRTQGLRIELHLEECEPTTRNDTCDRPGTSDRPAPPFPVFSPAMDP
jgi:hypothetical protein